VKSEGELQPVVTSLRNPRIVEARKLTQRKHREGQGRFLVEGLQILAMAAERLASDPSKVKPLEVFFCEELFTGRTAPRLLRDLSEAGGEPIHVASHVLDTLSARDVSQGLAATFDSRALEASLDELSATASSEPGLFVVLDRLQDPGNLGTLIRTADAAGARAVILIEPSVDPFDPKTVRGTMGSLFSISFARVAGVEDLWNWLDRQGLRAVGADATEGRTVWDTDALHGSAALVLGNEARGIDPDLRARLADLVGLPMLGKAESLNVSIAGAALMYEWLRVNRPQARDSGRPASHGA
jgi:TrmH family RNA methyltransferase